MLDNQKLPLLKASGLIDWPYTAYSEIWGWIDQRL